MADVITIISMDQVRALFVLVAVVMYGFGQTPEGFFRNGGADFRSAAPETKLYWTPHVEHSHERILQAADLAVGKGIAIVLGSGVATEIPLAELARRFERLILIDLDGSSMLASLDQVPLELRPKVELKVMDVTSFASGLMKRQREAVEASATVNEAFGRFDGIFRDLALGDLPNLPPSDLVVSSLLLSEIARFPFAYTGRLLSTRFNVQMQSWPGSEKAFQRLVLLSIEDHVRLLASISRPGGTIYYADTVARGPALARMPEQVRTAVNDAILSDFRQFGFAASISEVTPAIEHLCQAEHPVDKEVLAYERLLDACRRTDDSTFEPLLPIAEVQRQAKLHKLMLQGSPESWWWLAYPCAIATSPGAFYVNSWILRATK